MRPVIYSLQFRGQARRVRTDLLRLRLRAPSSALVTTVGAMGVGGRFVDAPGGEAFFRSELAFGDGSSFHDTGTVEFGHGNRLRFHSIGRGHLAPCPDPHLRQGSVVRRIEGGEGQFVGSEGLITSNFLFSDSGEVTDNHLGLIFVHDPPLGSTAATVDGTSDQERGNDMTIRVSAKRHPLPAAHPGQTRRGSRGH